tara:strand:- start:372 stop:635 length:264 start_codon:yes stop_codon:yes gene_type:complete
MSQIQIVEETVDINNFDHSKLPSDVHLITFTGADGKTQVDAVRAYTMVDIFDVYYDRIGAEGKIHSIQAGFGRIRPNLYGKIRTDDT